MQRSAVRGLLSMVFVVVMLTGCGGGGGRRAPDDGDDGSAAEVGTARFHVDVVTGRVTVTPIETAADTVSTAAILAGTSMHFDSTVLYDQPGGTGLKVMDVSLTNRSGLAIGADSDGTDVGIRVIFGDITPVTAASDIRTQVTVSTLAALGSGPSGVAVGSDGAVYVTGGNQVLKVQGGAVSVLAGDGVAGYVDGLGTVARFDNPTGIAQNPVDGSLIVADYTRHRLRRVTLAGVASTVAGTGVEGGTNGTGSTATFSRPAGVAVDAAGVIYVAEQGGHRVRRIALSSGDGTL
ncbi:hypothetical protein LLH23_16030, partial [bacterium]|nr:hypothetical protein [bacterium]